MKTALLILTGIALSLISFQSLSQTIFPHDGATYNYRGAIRVNSSMSYNRLRFFNSGSATVLGTYSFSGNIYLGATYGSTPFDGTSIYISFGDYDVEISTSPDSITWTIADTNSLTLAYLDKLYHVRCDAKNMYHSGLTLGGGGGYTNHTGYAYYYYDSSGTCVGSHEIADPDPYALIADELLDCSAPGSTALSGTFLQWQTYDVVLHAKDQNGNWLESPDSCFIDLFYPGKLKNDCGNLQVDINQTMRPTVEHSAYTDYRFKFLDMQGNCLGYLKNDNVTSWPTYADELYDCANPNSLTGTFLNQNNTYHVIVCAEVDNNDWYCNIDDTCTVGFFNCSTLSVVDSVITDSCGNNTGAAHALVSGGTAPYSYSWSTGASASQITSVAGGSYTVTVTDTNGCIDSLHIAIPGWGVGHDIISSSATITLTALGGNGTTYNWSNDLTSTTSTQSQITTALDGAFWQCIISDSCGTDTVCFLLPDLSGLSSVSCNASSSMTRPDGTSNSRVEFEQQSSFGLFPNPNAGLFTVQYPEDMKGLTLFIANLSGQIVKEQSLPAYSNQIQVQVPNLPTGFYLYQIRSENKRLHSGKFVIGQ